MESDCPSDPTVSHMGFTYCFNMPHIHLIENILLRIIQCDDQGLLAKYEKSWDQIKFDARVCLKHFKLASGVP